METRKFNIGIFDSGYGGLTIFKSIEEKLPDYNYIYLGDNARTPYGNRSFDTIYRYTLEAVKKLFELDCYLIIIACNTASAKALRTIQQKDLPNLFPKRRVLGIVRPSTEAIAKYSVSKKVGVLGTIGTVQSYSYPIEIKKFYPDTKVYQVACPMWVPLVENNEHTSDGANFFVKKYIDQLLIKNNKIDTFILACTHYPLLLSKILEHTPKHIKVLNQGEIVSSSLIDYLQRHPEIETMCKKDKKRTFLTTDSIDVFEKFGSHFHGSQINAEKISL